MVLNWYGNNIIGWSKEKWIITSSCIAGNNDSGTERIFEFYNNIYMEIKANIPWKLYRQYHLQRASSRLEIASSFLIIIIIIVYGFYNLFRFVNCLFVRQ